MRIVEANPSGKRRAGVLFLAGLTILAGLGGLSGCEDKAASSTETRPKMEAAGLRPKVVALTPVRARTFEERLAVQGNLEAKSFSLVSPRRDGTLEAVFVSEGDAVQAGRTKLFQVDSLNLEKTVEVRRRDLAVARCSLRERQAQLEQVQADLDKAKVDYKRYQTLYARQTVSADALEQQESKHRQLMAQRKYTRALIDLAAEQVRQAETSLAMAEKDLSDAVVLAPISGRISQRLQEPGERGAVGKTVVRIDDTSLLEVSAFLPAQYYNRIEVGRTRMRVKVYGLDLGQPAVSYKSPTIDSKLRTFEVKSVLENSEGRIAPGAMAEIEVLLEVREGLGVPLAAVLQRGGEKVLFVVENSAERSVKIEGGTESQTAIEVVKPGPAQSSPPAPVAAARLVRVETGLETDGWVELKAGGLTKGTPVVTEGQTSLKDGAPVTVSKGTD